MAIFTLPVLGLMLHCFAFGYSDVKEKKVCYGSKVRLSSDYTPTLFSGQMYFTPSTGGSRKLLMEKGEIKEPRLVNYSHSLYLRDVTERDEGTYSVSLDNSKQQNILRLKILDCAEEVQSNYKSWYTIYIPIEAGFLEFTPTSKRDQLKVLWNRTNPQAYKRGRIHMEHVHLEITKLIHSDSGFYNVRKKDNTLISRIKLTVTADEKRYRQKENDRVYMEYPNDFTPHDIIFFPERDHRRIMVMKAGSVVDESSSSENFNFAERMQYWDMGAEIVHLQSTDSGIFQFRDQQGNLALVVHLFVEVDPPPYIYIAVIAGSILVCCCCFKKCCCKKSSAKRESALQTTAAPAVYYHGQNQPEGPSYSAAPPAYSLNTLGSQEPTRETTSPGTTGYNSVDIHWSPTHPEVSVPGRQGSALSQSVGSDFLSSDSGPTFELKGSIFPSAPPLSSDSAFCDVYTSDKLNCL